LAKCAINLSKISVFCYLYFFKQQHGRGLVNTTGIINMYTLTRNTLQFLMQAQKMPAPPSPPHKLPLHNAARANAPHLQTKAATETKIMAGKPNS
jgi:hypothetical protein